MRGSSWALDGQIHLLSAAVTGPDAFVEWSTGLRGAWVFQQQSDTLAPVFFESATLPAWHVAWTAGVGVGFKVYRGRMLRLHVEADWLQLAQARTPDVVRVVDADVRGLNWLQGGYRPWRVTLTHDLFRRKPAESCANPTRSEASKTLFDPKKMKGRQKSQVHRLQKSLGRAGGLAGLISRVPRTIPPTPWPCLKDARRQSACCPPRSWGLK